MKSYKRTKNKETSLTVNTSYEGERIEQKIQRIVNNKEPISDGAPLIYTERKEGINPAHDIRTDRFEIAIEAMDKVTASMRAKRENKPSLGEEAAKNMKIENGEAKPAEGTEPQK